MTIMGLNGIYHWFFVPMDVNDRLNDVVAGGVLAAKLNFAFQVYDIVVSSAVKELRKIEMLIHHLLAIFLAYFILQLQYSHYYSVFFLGLTEFSSIPLCFVSLFKYFRKTGNKYHRFNSFCRILFAVLFLLIRCVYWPFMSISYFIDAYNTIKDGTFHKMGITLFFSFSNVFLTLLQLYWATFILKQLKKLLSPEQNSGKRKAKLK
mmetsp:Transcript_2467/g.3611  ORF Transcript_2467/g.3611 Transcript_2467/m.3611 type:complete len:206 (+) Transcript_2467:2036-2653(+)